jgi:Flp pilus assembly protein TadG
LGLLPKEPATGETPMIFSRLFRRKRSRRRVSAAVEFAMVAPVFFVFVFGIIECARALMVEQVMTNAARAGARVAILAGSTDAQVQTTLTNYLSAAQITGYSYTISPDLGTSPPPGSGTAITVSVNVPWSSVTWTGFLPSQYFSGNIGASVVMIHE